ncbi:MAG: recombinase family protein [Ruminococcaceae bacterium]|nr:recombinase family protein [Oscillospiraceae bacterium]
MRQFRAALYIRLSREDGDREESDSIGNQRTLLEDFARDEESIAAWEEFVDDGYSGTDFRRPGFARMMEALRARRLDCVIVKDLSRFGRNYIDAGRYLEQEFPLLGVRFISILDDIDSYTRPEQAGSILLPFRNLLNDEYSRDISRKIRAALDSRRRQGIFIGSHPPYGYARDPENPGHLLPEEETAAVVARIFREYLSGQTKSGIARRLNAEGVASPAARRGGGGLWGYSSVDHILKNPVYRGDLVQGRYGNISYRLQKTRRRDPADWITVPGAHEPLISPAEFDRAQALLRLTARGERASGAVHPLAGLVRCDRCGRPLQRRRVRQRYGVYEYYLCPTYRQDHAACTPHSLRVDRVEAAVLSAIREEIAAAVDFRRMAAAMREPKKSGENGKALEARLARVMEQKRGIYGDWKAGELTREEYLAFKEGYDRQEAELRRRIRDAAEPQPTVDETYESLADRVMPERLERDLAVTLIEEVRAEEGGALTVRWRFRKPEASGS